MLRFSANLCSLFTERPLDQRFRAACAAGFQAVELHCPYVMGVSPLGQLLQDNGLRLALIDLPLGNLLEGGDGLACVPGQEKEFRAAVLTAARYAEALGVPAVSVQAGRKPQGVWREACEATLVQNLEYAAGVFRDIGATLLLEAVNLFDTSRALVSTPDDMQRLCAAVPRLKMLFNCYHMDRMSTSMLDDLEACLPQVGHVRFADNPGGHEPGTGRIDFDAVFSLLRDSSYQGWCSADYQPASTTEDSLAWKMPRPQPARPPQPAARRWFQRAAS